MTVLARGRFRQRSKTWPLPTTMIEYYTAASCTRRRSKVSLLIAHHCMWLLCCVFAACRGIVVLFSNDLQLCSKAMINDLKALNRKVRGFLDRVQDSELTLPPPSDRPCCMSYAHCASTPPEPPPTLIPRVSRRGGRYPAGVMTVRCPFTEYAARVEQHLRLEQQRAVVRVQWPGWQWGTISSTLSQRTHAHHRQTTCCVRRRVW